MPKVRLGTAVKDANILIWGASNSGKTALTAPLAKIFEGVRHLVAGRVPGKLEESILKSQFRGLLGMPD